MIDDRAKYGFDLELAQSLWQVNSETERGDGENYNCGLIDVTDRPYKEQVEAMMETAACLYDVLSGICPPFHRQPEAARGYEPIPDLCNEEGCGINYENSSSFES